MNNDKDSREGSPLSIVLGALCILGLLSLLPWGELTGNRFKDFGLFSELSGKHPEAVATSEIIDPALAEALEAAEKETADSTAAVKAPADSAASAVAATSPVPYFNPRVDGRMVIEDYSNGEATARLREYAASGRLRCAMIGDSYIEGDIFAGCIRERLRERFGGAGVGYVPAYSAISGFRRTVRMSGSGFKACDIRHDRLDSLHTLPGEYFRADVGAKVSYKGEKGGKFTAAWDRSRIIFLAPADGSISTSRDGTEWTEHAVVASPEPQCIEVNGSTSRFDVRCDVPGLVVFGVWLDSPAGMSFDCMSLRGYSGISHRSLGISTARGIARWVDYNLIVVEYGMNALSSEQTDYTAYSNIMKNVVLRLKACYPSAVIIMLGVGDRGQKQGSEVASLPTVTAMVDAQRRAARAAGVMFWDTREAMGGVNSIVDWRDRGLVNADYVHLNYKGGKEMSGIFCESLLHLIDD